MNEVIGPFACDTTIGGAGTARLPDILREVSMLSAAGVLRVKVNRWSSALCEQDLACLLQVIEGDLIPQLLTSYSPARDAPSGLAKG